MRTLLIGSVMLLSASTGAADVLVLEHFTLIDGRGGAPLPDAAMVIEDGRIRSVGPAAEVEAPPDAEVMNLSGKFLMPGIINLHAHVGNVVGLEQDAKHFTRENVDAQLALYAAYGVTSVVSMGTDQPLVFEIRGEQRAGRPRVARVFTAFRGFTGRDGYPTSAPGIKGIPYEVETRADVNKAMKELASHEVDVVKVWVDDHMGQESKILPALSRAVVEEARRAGLKPVAHVFYLQDAKDLVHAGLAGMVHAIRDRPVDDELIADMKEHGAWQAASTLARELSLFAYVETPHFLDDPFFARAIPPDVRSVLKSEAFTKKMAADPLFARYPEFLETAKQNLKRLADAGIPYGFGTDSGPPARISGAFEHLEMELMVEAGLTPAQVITAATASAAEFLGASADLGTLEIGRWADLVVLGANPLEDIRHTRSIEAVYIAGNRVER